MIATDWITNGWLKSCLMHSRSFIVLIRLLEYTKSFYLLAVVFYKYDNDIDIDIIRKLISYVLPMGQMSLWGATVITNLMSAIPWLGQDVVEFIKVLVLILPTIGDVTSQALRRTGNSLRIDKQKFLSIPYPFLAMLVGFIDGDGYIAITRTPKGFIRIDLVISLHVRDLSTLQYMQSVLGIGRIKIYSKLNTCKWVISKTDLQEILLPLLLHHNLYFLTDKRREQFDKAMFILQNNIKLFSGIPAVVPSLFPLPTMASGYIALPFFKNWIVGFTMAEGSFLVKLNEDACFQLRQRKHVLLFEAFKIVFGTGRKIGLEGSYNLFSVSSRSDIQRVINFFSFSGYHPIVGYKLIQYEQWLAYLRNSVRYEKLKFPSEI